MKNCKSKNMCKYCAYYSLNYCLNKKIDVQETDGDDCESFDLNKYWFDRLERVYNLDKRLKDELEYEQNDEYGGIEYVKNIRLYLSCISYDKSNLDNIEDDILEILNNKAFDGIYRFEKR